MNEYSEKITSTLRLIFGFAVACVLLLMAVPSHCDDYNQITDHILSLLGNKSDFCKSNDELYIQRDTLIYYTCAHECFDSRSFAKVDDLDLQKSYIEPNPRLKGYAFIKIPCKKSSECVQHSFGTGIGQGTTPADCKDGYESKQKKKDNMGFGIRDENADQALELIRKLDQKHKK